MARGVTSNPVRVLVVGVAVAVSVWLGMGRIAGSSENERPQERGTVAGFTTYAVPSANFSIAVPRSWRTLTAEEAFGDGNVVDDFMRENPEFEQYRNVFADPRSPMKLIAIDPDVRGAFASNLNVIAHDTPDGYAFEDLLRESEAELDTLAGRVNGLENDVVDLPAGKAQRLSYEGQFTMNGERRFVATLQYGLVVDGWAYILTFTTLPELADEYEADFERSVHSFSNAD